MIDIIIPTYNGSAYLPTCLRALRTQTRRDFGVLVVDDGSTDDTLALLARDFPEVRVLALGHNRGFINAVNAGIRATSDRYVVLLNNDTEATPRWLEHLIGALERFPQYDFAASKLMLFDQRDHIHSAGDFYRPNGVPGSRGVWQRDGGPFNVMQEVWGPCAGAAAYQRAALEALAEHGNVFDPDLVMYCEDVDLNLRAKLQGRRTIFVPQAVVYHRLSATGGGALASYYCGRNFMLVWMKNMPSRDMRRWWPALVGSQVGFALHSLWHAREAAARARLRGQAAGLRALPTFRAKRQPLNVAPVPARPHAAATTQVAALHGRSSLTVVVPAYNEERRLPRTLERILAYLDAQPFAADVLVADDGSSDGTAALVERMAASHPNLRLLRLAHHGKGYAVRAGALHAEGQYVLLCDADLATPIEEWEKLHPFLASGYDVVIGSREGLGAQRLGEPWFRHVMGRVFNRVVQLVALGGIEDTQCGFKAFSRAAARDLFERVQLYGEHARPIVGAAVTAFDVEVLFLAQRRGYAIREVPVIWHYGEETKVSPVRDSLRNFRDVLQVRWNALRGHYDADAAVAQRAVEDGR